MLSNGLPRIFEDLVQCLDDSQIDDTGVVKAWAPVPYFGDLQTPLWVPWGSILATTSLKTTMVGNYMEMSGGSIR